MLLMTQMLRPYAEHYEKQHAHGQPYQPNIMNGDTVSTFCYEWFMSRCGHQGPAHGGVCLIRYELCIARNTANDYIYIYIYIYIGPGANRLRSIRFNLVSLYDFNSVNLVSLQSCNSLKPSNLASVHPCNLSNLAILHP